MMTFLAVGGGALTVYLSIVHRYLIKYTALGILILQNISYHISRALVAGTNKAGRLRSGLRSGRQGRRASLNRSARFNRHVFVVANNMTNINERQGVCTITMKSMVKNLRLCSLKIRNYCHLVSFSS